MDYSKIETLRKSKGIAKKFMLEHLEMSRPGFDTALKNKTLKVRDLEKVAEILGVSIISFFEEDNSPKHNIYSKQNGTGNINSIGGDFVNNVKSDSGNSKKENKQLLKERTKNLILEQENNSLKEQLKLKDEIIGLLKKQP